MILIIDHKDSFTFNLLHLCQHFAPTVVTDINHIPAYRKIDLVVFSPGPGKPADYPATKAFYEQIRGKLPILGVCLGFQLICECHKGRIIRAKSVCHGVQDEIITDPDSILFKQISKTKVGRYHSLQLDPDTLPADLYFCAWDQSKTVPMAFESKTQAVFGVQFHPESFLSCSGGQILVNLLQNIRLRSNSL